VAPFLQLSGRIKIIAEPSMDQNEPILSRAELNELHLKFREMKHGINNTFAVIMALSELGQRNPSHLEKLAKSVLERTPDVVKQMNDFGDFLGRKLRETPTAEAFPMSGAFPPMG
jgi:hypothetical protein